MASSQGGWAAQQRRQRWLRAGILALALLVFLVPLLWTLIAAFGVTPNDTNLPPNWDWPPTFENFLYIGVSEPGFAGEMVTGLSISVTATVLTLSISYLAAYSLAHWNYRRARRTVQIFLVLASLPVMAYIIPLSDLVRRLGLYDTFVGVALSNTAIFAPLAIYVLFGYLRQLPTDFEDAARLDGATLWEIILRIAAPLALPGLAALAIILFVLNWNLLLVPLVLTESHVRTVPVAMSDFFTFERELSWPVAAAVLIISLLPLVVLVAAAHRALERFSLRAGETEL